MAYAQINYPQKIGWCNLTIAQVGCFLTSFSNLEQRFGRGIDPPTLNEKFKALNLYLNGCDLAWNSASRYDSRTSLVATGSGVPPNNNAIVQFIYGNGNMHFCLVNDIANHTIVDSWDGKIRDWGYYGGPKYWATYKNNAAAVGQTVFLPASAKTWRLYRVGSGLRPNTSDQIAVLTPSTYGGLTYKIQSWVGNYAVDIQTQMFGAGTIWVANTEAVIK